MRTFLLIAAMSLSAFALTAFAVVRSARPVSDGIVVLEVTDTPVAASVVGVGTGDLDGAQALGQGAHRVVVQRMVPGGVHRAVLVPLSNLEPRGYLFSRRGPGMFERPSSRVSSQMIQP